MLQGWLLHSAMDHALWCVHCCSVASCSPKMFLGHFSVQAVASCSQNAVGEKEPQVWGQAHFAWSYYYISWKNTCYLKKTTSKLKNRQTNKNNKIEKSKSNAGLFITVDRMVWEKIKYHISIPDDIKPQKDILIIIIVPQITNWLRNLNSFQKWMRQGRRVSKSKK